MPPDPPVPILATKVALNLFVDFDQDLEPGNLDPTRWTMRWNGGGYAANIAWILPGTPRRVRTVMAWIAPAPGTNVCYYNPPPFDVISAKGIAAALFYDYPVT